MNGFNGFTMPVPIADQHGLAGFNGKRPENRCGSREKATNPLTGKGELE
jgi:hypothetical protein